MFPMKFIVYRSMTVNEWMHEQARMKTHYIAPHEILVLKGMCRKERPFHDRKFNYRICHRTCWGELTLT